MAIKKEYSQNKSECKVTFILPKELTDNFNKISVTGDFNNWSPEITLPMGSVGGKGTKERL